MTKERFKHDCPSCERETFHIELHRHKSEDYADFLFSDEDDSSDEIVDVTSYDESSLIVCMGCEAASLRIEQKHYVEGSNSIKIHNIYSYPDSVSSDWHEDDEARFLDFDDMSYLPNMIYHLYEEVQGAFREDASILAGIALRTLVEAVCIHQKISGRNLQNKIENLYTKGLIAKNDLPIIHSLREIGNISAHRVQSPSDTTLENALHVVNHTLRSIYIIPKKAKKIRVKKS